MMRILAGAVVPITAALVLSSCSVIPVVHYNSARTADVPQCSPAQVQALAFGDVDASTITATGTFEPDYLIGAGADVVCAGSYATSQPDADHSTVGLLVLHGGDQVFTNAAASLTIDGFPEGKPSGASTMGWNDGTTQIYAVNFSDQVDSSFDADFGSDTDDLVVILNYPAR